MKKRILYCVHRYAPFPGGSENYVRDLAEETLKRNYEVWVFAGEHQGDLNGVKLISDPQCIFQNWDLIVVHGGDVGLQNYVLSQSLKITSPILYLLILPSNSPVCVQGLHQVTYLGCSTPADWRHVDYWNMRHKARQVRHSINPDTSVGHPGFRKAMGIETPYMFLSCGGFWPNKAFGDLIEVFNDVNRDDVTLVLTGYDNRFNFSTNAKNVRTFMIDDRTDVLSAIREANLYLLHSTSEGFGLVLLEAMYNHTPWAARKIAGAELMQDYGFTYTHNQQLFEYLKTFDFDTVSCDQLYMNRDYVKAAHLIEHTVNDILGCLV